MTHGHEGVHYCGHRVVIPLQMSEDQAARRRPYGGGRPGDETTPGRRKTKGPEKACPKGIDDDSDANLVCPECKPAEDIDAGGAQPHEGEGSDLGAPQAPWPPRCRGPCARCEQQCDLPHGHSGPCWDGCGRST